MTSGGPLQPMLFYGSKISFSSLMCDLMGFTGSLELSSSHVTKHLESYSFLINY